jgi:copper chaperone CopZ
MATHIAPYVHMLDGRLRIKIPQVKNAPHRAGTVEQFLRGLEGVTDATANPTTGNVLVLFTSAVIRQDDIIAALRETGYLRESDHISAQDRKSLTSIVVQSVVELAIERLVLALI